MLGFFLISAGIAALFLGVKTTSANFSGADSAPEPFGPFNFFGPFLPYDENDYYKLARTIWGEARGEGLRGMQAVADVVINRYKAAQASPARASQWGATVAQICTKPYQFSCWNVNDPNRAQLLAVTSTNPQYRDALSIADQALRGVLPDITHGATSYWAGATPYWAQGVQPLAYIGDHTFVKVA